MREQEVSKKIKKSASSMSFSLSRRFRKISTARPSSFVISIIVISYAVFLFGGGLYTVISSPLPAYYTGKGFIFLYPELGSQFVSDTVIAVMLYAIGFIGLLGVFKSKKYPFNPSTAHIT